jgi:hypothetical protein
MPAKPATSAAVAVVVRQARSFLEPLLMTSVLPNGSIAFLASPTLLTGCLRH